MPPKKNGGGAKSKGQKAKGSKGGTVLAPVEKAAAAPLNDEEKESAGTGFNPIVMAKQSSIAAWERGEIPLHLLEDKQLKDKNVHIPHFRLTTPSGGMKLIEDGRLQLIYGRRYGLFGRNGTGKSMLLTNIAGYKFEGFPKHLRIVHVAQESDAASDLSALEYVLQSDEEKNYLEWRQEKILAQLEEEDADHDLDDLNEQLEGVYERLDAIGANAAEGRAQQILEGLQFTKERMQIKTKDLSGGWRMRVALACALFTSPDMLLLDEPTNHLDFPAVVWLESYLKEYEQTLVVVSHDRTFIDNIVTDVIELKDQKLTYYKGDYTTYEKVKKEQFANLKSLYEKQQKKIATLKEFISTNTFVGNENTAQLAKQKKKALEDLEKEAIPEPVEEKPVKISFQQPDKLDHALVEIKDMNFAYDPESTDYLLKDVNLTLSMGDRIGALGANGCGKTTLLKLITQSLQPSEGMCKLNSHARVALFTQHHIDQLDLNATPREYLQELYPDANPGRITGFLCSFGFDFKHLDNKIQTLSGGQKSRVAFAVLNWKQPHFIIMDEPTNHLDLETIDGLVEALTGFNGGLLVVSHDQYFLSRTVERFWAVNNEGHVQVLHDLSEAKAYSYKFSMKTVGAKAAKRAVPLPSAAELRALEEEGGAAAGGSNNNADAESDDDDDDE